MVLAPLFPAGIIDPDDLHNFKFIEYRGIRFDHALLAIVDEVAARYPVDGERVLPARVLRRRPVRAPLLLPAPATGSPALSIGAPGRITQLDDSLPWWLGTKDFEERFGQARSTSTRCGGCRC